MANASWADRQLSSALWLYYRRFVANSGGSLQSVAVAAPDKANRLSQVHGDFHPYNVLFRTGTDFAVLDRSRGEWGEPADDITAMTINYLLNSLIRWGKLKGPFEVLFRLFWDTYVETSDDKEVTETAAPFFAFRGLVVVSPLWYPNLSIDIRRSLFHFIENVLDVPCFEPKRVNEYCH